MARARDLHPLLGPVGEGPDWAVGDVGGAHEGQRLHRRLTVLTLLASGSGQVQAGAQSAGTHGVVAPHQHVVEGRQGQEQAQVLEGSRHAGTRQLVGPQGQEASPKYRTVPEVGA